MSEKDVSREEILNNPQFLESIINSLPGIAYVISAQRKFFWVNKKFVEVSGYTLQEIVTMSPLDIFLGAEKNKVEEKIKRVFEVGLADVEADMSAKDGKVTPYYFTGLRTEIGGMLFLVGMGIDISERKQREEESKNSQRLLQRIIDLLPIRVFWKDKNLKYIGCNEIFAKDAGKNSAEDLIGKDDYQMGWHEQAKIYQADDQAVIKSGKAKLNFEEPQTTPEGGKIWLKTSKVPLIDSKGNEIGILGTYEDITKRKQEESELQKKVNELESFNKITVERELRMIELKKKIEELEARLKEKHV
ncbi:MAG: PAS domain-containing protein [Candidatus Omnitrophota bacterium]|jgi:PAS domain S-box-containing protein